MAVGALRARDARFGEGTRVKTLGFTIAGALGLKAWFRDANADQLTWLLKPTVVLTAPLAW